MNCYTGNTGIAQQLECLIQGREILCSSLRHAERLLRAQTPHIIPSSYRANKLEA